MGLCSAAQGWPARSRPTLGTGNACDSKPERIVQNGPRISAKEGIVDVAVAQRPGLTFCRTLTGFARFVVRVPRVARLSSSNPGLRYRTLSAFEHPVFGAGLL